MDEYFFVGGTIVKLTKDSSEPTPYYNERKRFIIDRVGTYPIEVLELYSIMHCDAIFYRSKYDEEAEKELVRMRNLNNI